LVLLKLNKIITGLKQENGLNKQERNFLNYGLLVYFILKLVHYVEGIF